MNANEWRNNGFEDIIKRLQGVITEIKNYLQVMFMLFLLKSTNDIDSDCNF